MELVHPVLAVAQQEVQNLVLSIVKTKAVPCRMLAAASLIEVLARIAGKVAKTLHFILHRMAVNNIHNDRYAHTMSLIYQSLQFLRRAESAAGSEETAHMIAETAIIGMLLNGHNLDAIITCLVHTRQHVYAELLVRAYLLCILSHADMALVNEQRTCIRFELVILPFILVLGLPHLGREYLCLLILNNTTHPSRNTLALTAFPMHAHLVQVSVLQSLLWQYQFPITAVAKFLEGIVSVFLPSIEIANKVYGRCIGGPLADNPVLAILVQTEIQIAGSKLRKGLLSIVGQFCNLVQGRLVSAIDGFCILSQILVVSDKTKNGRSLFFFRNSHLLGACLLGTRFLCRCLLGSSCALRGFRCLCGIGLLGCHKYYDLK